MIGTTIGSYRIVEKLGEGAMGAVYRAVDEMLDRDVAVKALRPELSRQAALVERFRSEAVALARLNHPNIAIVHGLVQHQGQLYMVMEYVQGETLERLLERCGPLEWHRAFELAAAATDGLQHAHEHGVVHRDIKPSNLMLSRRGVLKLMDFGVARLVDRNRQTRTGMAVGTRMYMCPEQLRGQDVDGRADVYAMGAVLFELVTGHMPFEAESEYDLLMAQLNEPPPAPSNILPLLPGSIDAIVARAMEKRPADRYASAMEMRHALQAALGKTPPGVVSARSAVAEHAAVPAPEAAGAPAPPTRLGSAALQDRAPAPPTRIASPEAPPVRPTRVQDAGEASLAAMRVEPSAAETRRTPAARTAVAALFLDWRSYAALAGLLLVVGVTVLVRRQPSAPESNAAAEAAVAQPLAASPATMPASEPTPARPTSGGPGFQLPEMAANERAPSRESVGDAPPPSRAPGKGEAVAPTPRPVRSPAQAATAPAQPPAPEHPAAEAKAAPAGPATVAPGQVAGALEPFVTAVRTNAAAVVQRLYAAAGEGDAKNLQQLLDLMKQGGVEIEAGSPDGPLAAVDGRARLELPATARWRTPFGGNRRRDIRLAAELEGTGGGWRLVSVRILGAGLK